MSVISDAIEASFRQECDQETCHAIASALADAMHGENDGKRPSIADGTVGLAIYCAHYIEACCEAGEDAPDKEMHFFEALGGLIRAFLLRPDGSHAKRQGEKEND
jgi:hypothetical protein